MEIINETEQKSINLEFEMGLEEISTLVNYADEIMPKEILDELKIEWAINNLLTEYVKTKKM